MGQIFTVRYSPFFGKAKDQGEGFAVDRTALCACIAQPRAFVLFVYTSAMISAVGNSPVFLHFLYLGYLNVARLIFCPVGDVCRPLCHAGEWGPFCNYIHNHCSPPPTE